MDAFEIDIANWLKANGIAGDAAAAKAVYSALDRPGTYGTLQVTRQDQGLVVSGPAGPLTVSGGLDLQTLRLRLQEIISHPATRTA